MIFKNNVLIEDVRDLENKDHYLALFNENHIDKEKIYELTAKINNCLNSDLRIKSLKQRMVFTACALVAERYGLNLVKYKTLGYPTLKPAIYHQLETSLEDSIQQNAKLGILLKQYDEIIADCDHNELTIAATDNFIDNVIEISKSINSSEWNGEDVMGIFFNEFNRYKGKTEEGQVFTPDHITSFMYRLLDVNKDDRVLDATCGSGAFLTKAMSNMIKEAGGPETCKAKEIKQNQLYGIEFDREIFALACANMLMVI